MALSPEQHALRLGRIGSSVVAAVAGKHPNKTPMDAYAEITGASTFDGNEQTEIGDVLESPIATMYAKRLGVTLVKGVSLVHSEREWAIATPDFGVPRDDAQDLLEVKVSEWVKRIARNVEVKCVGEWRTDGWNADVEGPEGIPLHYWLQVEWQMGISGVHITDVVALLGGTKLHVWTVHHSPRLFAALLGRAEAFYRAHIVERVPPPPDGSDAARDILAAAFPREREALRPAELEDDILARQLLAAKVATKAAKAEEARIAQLLEQRIGDAEGVWAGDWKATWKYQPPTEVRAFTKKGGRVLRLVTKGGGD